MATTIDQARKIKPRARNLAEEAGTVTGVGLTKVGASYAVKVNFERSTAAMRELPKKIDGVTIVYDVTGAIKPR